MAVDIEEIKLIIRSLLISYKDPPPINILRRDFKESEGRDIPFSKLGYSNVLDFLHSLKDTVVVLPDKSLKAVATAQQQHLVDLIAKQKRAKSSLKNKRASTRHGRSPYRPQQRSFVRQRDQSRALLSKARYSGSKTNYNHAPQSSVTSPKMELCDTYSDTSPSHAILLVQPGSPDTRTYSDYESVNECMEVVCKIYEEHLKEQYPNIPYITYGINQLFDFLDQLADLSCLVYQRSTNTYQPCNKDWIKEKIYTLFKWAA